MRLSLLLFSFFCLALLFSCSVNKPLATAEKNISGSWQLQTIVSEGVTEKITTPLFNEADFNCFIGSQWNFQTNNSGNFIVTASRGTTDCAAINRPIIWNIYTSHDQPMLLTFKRLAVDGKEIDANFSGNIFTMIQLNNNRMQWRADVNIHGKPAAFIYNFIKI